MHLSELKALHVSQLLDMAVANDIEGANRLRKHELIFALLKNQAKKGETIFGDGTLEMLPDGEDFCIMLGDLPLVGKDEMIKLKDRFSGIPEDRTVFTPCRNGVFGHPMFYRAIWKERFKAAQGDAGGRNILREHKDEIMAAETSDCHFRDIDTPDDYEKLVNKS